jgi:hypothetical protein
MPTGQVIVNNALTALGVLEQGGTPSVSDSTDALAELNTMWDAWSIDENLIYAQKSYQGPLVSNKGIYTIGTGAGADFSTARPSRIYHAYIVPAVVLTGTSTLASPVILTGSTAGMLVGQLATGTGVPAFSFVISITANTSVTLSQNATATASVTLLMSGGNRTEVNIVEASRYYAHNDLGALSTTPDELYADYSPDTLGLMRLYLYPMPTCPSPAVLDLDAGVPFTAWTLTGSYMLPPGYQDSIQQALAWRLIPRFGAVVDPKVAQVVAMIGQKAEARITMANAINRQRQPVPLPTAQPAPAAQAQQQ